MRQKYTTQRRADIDPVIVVVVVVVAPVVVVVVGLLCEDHQVRLIMCAPSYINWCHQFGEVAGKQVDTYLSNIGPDVATPLKNMILCQI